MRTPIFAIAAALSLAMAAPSFANGTNDTTSIRQQVASAPAEHSARYEALLNQPDPVINAPLSSRLRDGAGGIVNPATGTSLPWTVQPD